MKEFILLYGYPIVALGSFFEGETVVVLGGIVAKLGYLDIWDVVLAAFVGSFIGDQLYFYIGRRWGKALLLRRPSWRMRAEKVDRLIVRYDVLFILGFRFVYGLRTVSPFAIGMSGVPALKFLVFNFVAAAIWAVAIAWLGFAFGHSLELMLDKLVRYERFIIGGVIAAGLAFWIARIVMTRLKTRKYVARTHFDDMA